MENKTPADETILEGKKHKKKHKKGGLKRVLDVGGEPVTVGNENRQPFAEWIKIREQKDAK